MTRPRAIHFKTGDGPRCGRPHAACLTSDEANVTCRDCLLCMRADSAPATIHLDAGGRPRCGHRGDRCLTADQAKVDCGSCLNLIAGGNVLGLRHPDWQLSPHGTRAAYRRHLRRGTRPCESCLQAERRAWHERKRSAA